MLFSRVDDDIYLEGNMSQKPISNCRVLVSQAYITVRIGGSNKLP